MEWIRMHPYVSALVAVGILFLVGAYIVKERTAVAPNPSSTIAWGGGGGFLQPTTGAQYQGGPEEPDLYRRVQSGPPFWFPASSPNTSEEETQSTNTFDIEALISLISPKDSGSQTDTSGSSLFSDAYSFLPRGLIATSTPGKEYTPAQEALRAYGNEAGSYIQSFEERNRDMARVLKDQFEDRENPLKNAALVGLADGLAGVGDSLLSIEIVPEQAASANAKLAASYRAMGAKLRLIPDANTEEARIQAMLAYNATVEEFIKSYTALATLFSLSEVTFRTDEPGTVFMFSGGF